MRRVRKPYGRLPHLERGGRVQVYGAPRLRAGNPVRKHRMVALRLAAHGDGVGIAGNKIDRLGAERVQQFVEGVGVCAGPDHIAGHADDVVALVLQQVDEMLLLRAEALAVQVGQQQHRKALQLFRKIRHQHALRANHDASVIIKRIQGA